MTVAIDADEFRRFGDVDLTSTGTLTGDIAHFAFWLEGALNEVTTNTIGERFWSLLDPMTDLHKVDAHLTLIIYPELRAQGMTPPTIDPNLDPIGFVKFHAAFLASARLLVDEPKVTVH